MEQRWIPVAEQLPENNIKVWLSFTNQYASYVKSAFWNGRCFEHTNGKKVKDKPTAWKRRKVRDRMNRAETTKFLGNLLKSDRFCGMGKYWASEVSIDAFTATGKGGRVDFMQFVPQNQYSVGGLEKGIFVCYEVKSCKADVYSGNGLNFYGEKNYIVTTMQCYKDILSDLNDGTFIEHLRKANPESSVHYGIMVAVPVMRDKNQEFEEPTAISDDISWRLEVIKPCIAGSRNKPLTELLFCMVRSGK